jgi:hypothetical protein
VSVTPRFGELADNLWRDKQRRTLGIDALWREVGAMGKRIEELEAAKGAKRRAANWTPTATASFWTYGDSEYCLGCGKHVSRHYGGLYYRCDSK